MWTWVKLDRSSGESPSCVGRWLAVKKRKVETMRHNDESADDGVV